MLSGELAELTDQARELQFPITNTLMGLGAYPATDPLFVGMLGMHGLQSSRAMRKQMVIQMVRVLMTVWLAILKNCPHMPRSFM